MDMLEGLFQPMHPLVIAGIALLIFRPKKLPNWVMDWEKDSEDLRPQ